MNIAKAISTTSTTITLPSLLGPMLTPVLEKPASLNQRTFTGGDSVQYVVQVQRYANGRKVSEVVEVLGYDRTAKVFEFDTKFNRADSSNSAQLTLPAEWAQFASAS